MSAHLFANAPDTLGSAPAGFLPEGLEREVRKIYELSPVYVQRFPLHFERLKWSCFHEIPALSKKKSWSVDTERFSLTTKRSNAD